MHKEPRQVRAQLFALHEMGHLSVRQSKHALSQAHDAWNAWPQRKTTTSRVLVELSPLPSCRISGDVVPENGNSGSAGSGNKLSPTAIPSGK